ncbi:autotransporter outer membrane beta-barrel domain-containing protein [Desulfocurvibacter africanus]|uniref:autotransporter family protein n=1 Tax=Desulfocurvibacter africanus TaxID=873 RepID=UPI00048154E5|nr:autotransporter outer membrane beta-barrel domain-containing protein [Desulfocurvibacter africanus]
MPLQHASFRRGAARSREQERVKRMQHASIRSLCLAVLILWAVLPPRWAAAEDNHGYRTTTLSGNAVNYGTIATAGNDENGMLVASGQSAVNAAAGSVSTTGMQAYGIWAQSYSTASNSGSISTTGSYAYGIRVRSHSTASNSGSISTTGLDSHGLLAGQDSTASNSGSITTSGEGAFGLYVSNSEARNSGSITTSGENASGLFSYYSTASNSGSITTSGTDAHGLYANDNSTVSNSGSISTTGTSAYAVYADNNSTAILTTGTRILNGDVSGDNSSSLILDGSGEVDFNITGAWAMIRKTGGGAWSLARNVSAPNDFELAQGSLVVTRGTALSVGGNYTQAAGTSLVLPGGVTPALSVAGTANFGGNLLVDPSAEDIGNTVSLVSAATLGSSGFGSVGSYNPHFRLTTSTTGTQLRARVEYDPQYDSAALGLASTLAAGRTFTLLPAARTRTLLAQADDSGNTGTGEPVLVAANGSLSGLLYGGSRVQEGGFYLQPVYSHARREAYDDSPGYTADTGGLELGADTFLPGGTLVGGFAGYATTDIDLTGPSFSETDREDQRTLFAGLYAGQDLSGWVLSGTLMAAGTDHETERNAGLNERARADYDSWAASVDANLAYPLYLGAWQLTPEAGLSALYLDRPGYSEQGATNALTYADYDEWFLDGSAGLRLQRSWQVQEALLTPYASLAVVQALTDNDLRVRQTIATTDAEVVQDEDDTRLAGRLGLVLSREGRRLELIYANETSEHTESHGLLVNLRFEF